MALSKSVNLAHAQRAVPCNVCEDEVPGEYYCIECKQTLCPQCEKNHKRVAATKNHNLILRTQVGDIDTTTFSCTDHGDPASFHCEKCDIPVCIKCVTGKHKGHNMSDLDDILEKEKKGLQNDTEALQDTLLTLQKKKKEVLMKKEKYLQTIKQITKDMKGEYQAVMKEIQKVHTEEVNTVTTTQNCNLAIYDDIAERLERKITSYEKQISENEEALVKGSLPAIRNIAKRNMSTSEVGSTCELPDPPKFVPANIKAIVGNLGKLYFTFSPPKSSKLIELIKPTFLSKIICPLKGYPRICITKEDDVWLGGYESRELVMVDIKGRVLKRRKISNFPNEIAMMDCGDFIICPYGGESSIVSRLTSDGIEQHVFNATPSWAYGVSVTADQKILICTYDGRVVMTKGDGTNTKQVYQGSGDKSAAHAVENSDGNIYISEKGKCAVVMINKAGKVLATITHTTEGKKLLRPAGIVADRMGNILCGDISHGCVFIIDQNQQMKELIGRSHGIQRPGLMAVDSENNLWITESNGTVHIVKYLIR